MPHDFQVAAKGIVVDRNRVLLLLKRWSNNEYEWDLPGGRLEQGESFEEGLKREVSEELPRNTIAKILGIIDAEVESHKDCVIVYFQIKLTNKNISLSDEHKEFLWVTAAEFQNLEAQTGYRMYKTQVRAVERMFDQMPK